MNNTNNYQRLQKIMADFINSTIIELNSLNEDIEDSRNIQDVISDLKTMLKATVIEIQDYINNPYLDLKEANVEDVTDSYNRIEYITPSNVQVIDIEPQVITIELETIDISNELSITFTYPDDFIFTSDGEGQGQKQCDIENYIIFCDIPQDPVKMSPRDQEQIYCDIEKYLTLYVIPQGDAPKIRMSPKIRTSHLKPERHTEIRMSHPKPERSTGNPNVE